jgi:hypothetical protein
MHDDCNYQNIKNLRIERVEARVRFNITNCISETMKVLNGTSTASMVTIEGLKNVTLNELVVLTERFRSLSTLKQKAKCVSRPT